MVDANTESVSLLSTSELTAQHQSIGNLHRKYCTNLGTLHHVTKTTYVNCLSIHPGPLQLLRFSVLVCGAYERGVWGLGFGVVCLLVGWLVVFSAKEKSTSKLAYVLPHK